MNEQQRAGNPAMLILARESRVVTQGDLASRIGISQGAISKIENGQLPLTAEIVAKAAQVLSYPPSFFYCACAYRNLPVTFYRKRAKVPGGVLKAIRAQTHIVRAVHVRALLESADIPELAAPFVDLDHRDGDVEEVARDLRMQWHVPQGPVDNVTALIEAAGVLVVRCDLGTDRVDALSLWEPDGLPPVIFTNVTAPGDRLRYSLCHELAHVVLHHHSPTRSIENPNTEEEADRFAAEFLVPSREIRSEFGRKLDLPALVRLKERWNVSMQMLIRRARYVERITERTERMLFAKMSRLGLRKREPGDVPREEPTLIRELVDFHLGELGYSKAELADLMHSSAWDLGPQYLSTGRVALARPPVRQTR